MMPDAESGSRMASRMASLFGKIAAAHAGVDIRLADRRPRAAAEERLRGSRLPAVLRCRDREPILPVGFKAIQTEEADVQSEAAMIRLGVGADAENVAPASTATGRAREAVT